MRRGLVAGAVAFGVAALAPMVLQSRTAAEQVPGFKSEWRVCDASRDCTLVEHFCAGPYAVNRAHQGKAQKVLDQAYANASCMSAINRKTATGATCSQRKCKAVYKAPDVSP